MASFEARYEAVCSVGCDIEVGETVTYDDDGDLWHTECLRQDRAGRRDVEDAEICTDCFMTKPCFCD